MSSKLYINSENLKHNIDYIKSKINKNTGIIAMVKANAYGCGSVEISKFLQNYGIKDFGVALVSEGVKLRENGINSNILVTSQFLAKDFEDIIKYNLTVSCSDIEMLTELNKYAQSINKYVKIHLKIDTGMGRLGFDETNIYGSASYIKENLDNIIIDGIYSHLSCADCDDNYTKKQLELFDRIVNKLQKNGYSFNYIHILNSAGILNYPNYQYTHVRSGILIYGFMPDSSMHNENILPCITLKAPIIRIHEITETCKISYGGNYTAQKGQKIATIQIGYADGLSRTCSNKYSVYVNEHRCPIVGNVCMDMCMIDITSIKDDLKIGDEVTIFKTAQDVEELAKINNTINYAIISRLNERIEKIII